MKKLQQKVVVIINCVYIPLGYRAGSRVVPTSPRRHTSVTIISTTGLQPDSTAPAATTLGASSQFTEALLINIMFSTWRCQKKWSKVFERLSVNAHTLFKMYHVWSLTFVCEVLHPLGRYGYFVLYVHIGEHRGILPFADNCREDASKTTEKQTKVGARVKKKKNTQRRWSPGLDVKSRYWRSVLRTSGFILETTLGCSIR